MILRTRLTILLIALSALALAGCAPKISAGQVQSKHDYPAYVSHDQETTYGYRYGYGFCSDGKYDFCYSYGSTGTKTVDHKHAERWTLTIEDDAGKTAEVEVPQSVYSEAETGQWYEVDSQDLYYRH